MIGLEKSEFKIPFKKLEWRDNVTDVGKKTGLIYLIGDFHIDKTPSYFIEYRISNSYSGGERQEKMMVFCNKYDSKLGDFDSIDEAKDFCQSHFQGFIMDTFFNKIK